MRQSFLRQRNWPTCVCSCFSIALGGYTPGWIMLTSHQPLHEGWLARETDRNGLISFHFLFGNHYSFAQRLRRLPTIFPQGFGKFLNRTACVSLSWPLALFAARCVVFFVSQLFHRPSLHGSKESQVSSDQKIRRSGRLYNLKLQHLVGFRTQKPLRWKNTNISGCKVFHFLTNTGSMILTLPVLGGFESI